MKRAMMLLVLATLGAGVSHATAVATPAELRAVAVQPWCLSQAPRTPLAQ